MSTQSYHFKIREPIRVELNRWQRFWLWVRRKPWPTVAPPGSRPMTIKFRDGDREFGVRFAAVELIPIADVVPSWLQRYDWSGIPINHWSYDE